VATPPALETVRTRVDPLLERFLSDERAEIEAEHPGFVPLLDEVIRFVGSGGKRLRPAFCFWGYRAAGGVDEEAIIRVGAGLELFHTFALIHDDVMDRGETRRGQPTVHVRMGKERADLGYPDAEQFGVSTAVLAGDLASVLADHLFSTSGFRPELLLGAFRRYNHMRIEVAVGQFLDISSSGGEVDEDEARRISLLKSGSYTAQGPLAVGAILGEAGEEVLDVLGRYGALVGEAFQLRDDLAGVLGADLEQAKPTVLLARARARATPDDRAFLDRHVGRGPLTEGDRAKALEILRRTGAIRDSELRVEGLIDEAVSSLDRAVLGEEPASALRSIAEVMRTSG
jgi:geranylgeranyl diphosphate synthase, type I